MAKPIVRGRYSATIDDPFVIFLIGMRVNRLGAVNKWMPTMMAMNPMLKTLYRYPEKGFLGAETFFRLCPIEVVLISYWKSLSNLEYFARNADDPHLESWRKFNQSIGSDGTVGIWHETYEIEPQSAASIYVNMPVFGLAAATQHQKITS